jgi:ornithine carbamoyltransferase
MEKEISLCGRSFLKLSDYSSEEIEYLLDLSMAFKKKKDKGENQKYFPNKNIVLLFEKSSTRTRCSFEVAGMDLGMGVTYLDPGCSQMGKKETIKDTARVLGRMYDGIEYRGYGQGLVEEMSKYAGVPVWNGLTTEFHPTQMIGDLLTIKENFGKLKGLNFTFMGDGRNNVANSLMVACSKMGINFTCCAPKDLFPHEELIKTCKEIAKLNECTLKFVSDVKEGTKDANIIYTDVWVSMGEPDEVWEKRIKLLTPYRVTKELMENAADNAIFMHCLPSFHDINTKIGKEILEKFKIIEMEVTDEVFESERSKVFTEAENRMHSIKAIMYATLEEVK